MLAMVSGSCLSAKFSGPYLVTLTMLSILLFINRQEAVYHINMLKAGFESKDVCNDKSYLLG